ncbi:phage portal protein [Methylocella sp.]|jgi:lambda family phage portal protein|uniref:phage portal protein n=1 Tax=Methylocella sp. TaxID=1978226 RepID=UPI003C22F2AD
MDFVTGGRRGKGWSTVPSINADVLAARGMGPGRARYAAYNQPLIASCISAFVSNMIGPGIRIVPATGDADLDKILSQSFEDKTDTIDFFGRQTFYGLQSTLATRYFVDGESIALMVNESDDFKIKIVDQSQVDNTANIQQEDGGIAIAGVVLDPTGRPKAYDFYRNYIAGLPLLQNLERVRIPAEDVLHFFRVETAGQVRGLSHLSASLLRAKEHDGYCDAQLLRMRTGAMLCGFVTDADGTLLQDAPGEASLEPGTIQRLKPGESYTQNEATKIGAEVNDHEKSVIREICAGAGVPSFMVTFDLSEVNFSSARVGILEFRKKIAAHQDAFAFSVLRPVWRRFVTTEILSGRLDAPLNEDTLRHRCISPKQEWLQPDKDVAAEATAIAAGLMSRKEAVAARGWDIETIDAEFAADKAREERLGLSFELKPQPAAPQPIEADNG